MNIIAGRDHETPSGSARQGSSLLLPTPALLHASMLMSGFGTVFLGPVLPALATGTHTSDSGSGLFFTAQFIGAFLGGVTTSRHLWRSLLFGSGAAALGFVLLAICTAQKASLNLHLAALLPLGFGVGQMLTSTNLLAAHRSVSHRGAALALVNFSWSLGAVSAPLVLGRLLATTSLFRVLLAVACFMGVVFIGAALNSLFGRAARDQPAKADAGGTPFSRTAFLYFGGLLLLYGGVETSLSGWVTTFSTRYGDGKMHTLAVGTAALWVGITAGRACAPVLLRRMREHALLVSALVSAALLIVLLSLSRGNLTIVVLCALLGLSLAPWFPLVLSAMLAEGAGAGQVGSIIALSGIGAATIPLLVGVASRASGSLRIALAVPLTGLLCLLTLSIVRKSRPVGLGSQ